MPFWLMAGVVGVSLFGMVAAFGTAPTGAEIQGIRQTVVERLALPAPEAIDNADGDFMREERIRRGDTVADVLARLGVHEGNALEFLRGNKDADAIFRQMSPGKNITARIDGRGELQSLIFPLNGGRDQALFIEKRGGGFDLAEQPLHLETRILLKSAEIRHSLFGAADAAGIPDSVATGLADIFGGDIDFHRDIRKGDHFSVIFESVSHMGRPIRSGRILAAEFVNDGRTYRAVWFEGTEGRGGYYTADGKSIRKTFLRSPLEFSRITSGFTSARFHPVLQKWRAHKGVDYGAPTGTRVRATGDGVVEFVGVMGGYGKVVILRHQGSYTTLYAHLSRFAAGMRKGVRVAQGDAIAYVGATGLASGPHLHYEFRIGGTHRNPLAVALPTAPPLAAHQMPLFKDQAQGLLARIDLVRGINLALLE